MRHKSRTRRVSDGDDILHNPGAAVPGAGAVIYGCQHKERASDFTVTIVWGDGTSSAGTILSTGNGTFEVAGSHTYTSWGTDPVTVTVYDSGGNQVTGTSTARVGDAPLAVASLALTATEGQTFQGAVASLTDADPNGLSGSYTPLIQWGDGTSSLGTAVANGQGGFWIEGSHVYAEDGSYRIAVSVTDSGGSQASAAATTYVADAPLTASGLLFNTNVGASWSGVVARFSDLAANGVPSNYTATISWGDGTSTAGTVASDSQGGFVVLGSSATPLRAIMS